VNFTLAPILSIKMIIQNPRQSAWLITLLVVMLIGGLFAFAQMMGQSGEILLAGWIGIALIVSFIWYAYSGDLLVACGVWLITLMIFHEEFWRAQVPGFFAVSISRLGLAALGALFVAMMAFDRFRLRWPKSILIPFCLLVTYFTLSAFLSGFETRSVITVHYRLIGGYLFPLASFVIVLHAFRHEADFRRVSIFFAAIAIYLVFTGWCEQFGLTALTWPRFISDPSVGIHWTRVRGPFVSSPALGLALIFCFFSNLVLARNTVWMRWPLLALNTLMLPVLFWTRTRSVWLSFAVCLLVWVAYSRQRMSRVVLISGLTAAVLLIAVINMNNFLGDDRAKGGLTDIEPITLRIGLARMSWELVQDHPLFGVGFGHFRDFAPGVARDPSSPYFAFGTTALEHNNLLSIVSETGVVGLALYLALMIALLRYSIRLFKKLPPGGRGFINRDLLVLYWILFAAYVVDGTFRETSDNPFANCLFFGLSAIPVALDMMLGPGLLHARRGFATIDANAAPLPATDEDSYSWPSDKPQTDNNFDTYGG